MRLDEYVQAVQEKSRAEFEGAYRHHFLLLHLDKEDAGSDWSFKTTTVASNKISIAKLLDRSNLSLSSESNRLRIFPLLRGENSPWAERVSVGRARNNDIMLPHKSVSKLHAHFVTSADGQVTVVDAGSRNGTRINDGRVSPNEPTAAHAGDTVTFGAVSLMLIDARTLYDLVKKHLRPRGSE